MDLAKIRSALGLEGNILLILSIRTFDSAGWQMFEAIWQPYLLSLGASMRQVGIISSTYLAFFASFQFFTGSVSDSYGRKQTMIMAYILSLVSILAIFIADSWLMIVPIMILFALVDALADPAVISLVAESVPVKNRGSAFGYLSQTWFLPGLFAPALGGFIGNIYGFKSVLLVILLTETISLILFKLYVKETLVTLRPLNLLNKVKSFIEIVKPEARLLRLYSTVISDRFAYALFDGVLYAMIIKSYGLTTLTIAIAANIFTLTTAISLFSTGRIVDSIGSRAPIIASNIFWVFALGAYFYSHNLKILYLAQVLRGISVSLWDPALNTYVASQTLESDRGRVTGKVGAIKGILTFPAPVIGAILFDTYGFSGPIILSVLGIMVSTFFAIGLEKNNL